MVGGIRKPLLTCSNFLLKMAVLKKKKNYRTKLKIALK